MGRGLGSGRLDATVEDDLRDLARADSHTRPHRTGEVQHVVVTRAKLGIDRDHYSTAADAALPDARVDRGSDATSGPNVELVADEFVVDERQERANIATDVEHDRTACGRRLRLREVPMMPMSVVVITCHESGTVS